MRAIVILAVIAVLGFFGYQYAAEGRGPVAAVGVLSGATAEAEAEAAAAQAALDEADAEAEAEAEAAAAQAALDEAAAEAEAAAQAVTDEAEAAVQATIDEAAATTEAAAAEATEAIEEAGGDVMALASELLTVDGFDANKVMELLDGADISALEKATLSNALNAAKDNPALLQPVLDQLSSVLGL
jgi:F0F1-type ATP synthase membrane subunit b/b'